jgi:copper/silver efflux system protein
VIMSAVGGEGVTTTVEGRERYPVNVRYLRDYRSTVDKLGRTLVPTMNGAQQIPLSQIADIKLLSGPGMIRDENGRLSGYVYVDVGGRDIGGYVEEAKRVVQQKVQMPPGYTLVWSGQYENMLRVAEKLKVVLPVTLFFIFLLMYLNTKSAAYTLIVLGSLPFSAAGAFWMLYLLDYNLSVAVWVGLIAFLGVDAETSVFMLLYLDLAYDERKAKGLMRTQADLREAILQGAVQRLRPKFMTVAVDFIGLMPVMLAIGAGADLTKRIAAPMIAGMLFSFTLELVVYPAIYALWKWHTDVKRQPALVPEAA